MKLKDNHYLMEAGTNQQLFRADPVLYERIMASWAALPATLRSHVCERLGFYYPLRAWGNENGFGFWTMNRYGARIAFHVGEPPALRHMLLTVKIGNENNSCRASWNNKRPASRNTVLLREKIIRAAFEKMAISGPKHREWIHGLINEIYPIS